jgi:hypothetical protein
MGFTYTHQIVEPTGAKLGGPKAFLQKHLHAVIALTAAVAIVAIILILNFLLNHVHLTITSNGLDLALQTDKQGKALTTKLPVRILSYNADIGGPLNLLYYIDTEATISSTEPGKASQTNQTTNQTNQTNYNLNLDWDIPLNFRHRATYTEICVLDDGEAAKDSKANQYCTGVSGAPANQSSSQVTNQSSNQANSNSNSTATAPTDYYNKVSCVYYLPANSTGFIPWLFSWWQLDDHQKVGCAGGPEALSSSFGPDSLLESSYGFGGGINQDVNSFYNSSNLPDVANTSNATGLTMQNFFESILNGRGDTTTKAGDILNNSLSNNFYYDQTTQTLDLSETGVTPGQSCDASYTFTQDYNRPAQTNGSDNSTSQTFSCIPIFSVDKYGRITDVTTKYLEYDSTTGNEVVGVAGSNSGLKRYGAGTAADPYTLAVSINNQSLKLADNQIAIVAPKCDAKQQPSEATTDAKGNFQTNTDTSLNKLVWTTTKDGFGYFSCQHDQDNQQLSISGQSSTSKTNVTSTTTTISLTGDKASQIHFVTTDTFYTQDLDSNGNPTSGLTVNNSNHTLAINAPYCAAYQKTVWQLSPDGHSGFNCLYTTDQIIRGNETGYVNDKLNGLTIVDNSDGTTTISLTDSGVILGHYGNDFLGDTTTGPDGLIRPDNATIPADGSGLNPVDQATLLTATTFKLPVFTVSAQGQIVASQTQAITKARLTDSQTSGLTLIGDGSVAQPYEYSVNLTSNGGLAKGGTGQLGNSDQIELKSCPAGFVLASKGQGKGYDCFHIDALEDVNQSYHAGTSLSQVLDWQTCTAEVFTTSHCYDPESGTYNPSTAVWTYTACTSFDQVFDQGLPTERSCSYQAGGTFDLKYDSQKGLTLTDDNDTGQLAINHGNGLTFNNDGKLIANQGDGLVISSDNSGKLQINAPTCTATSTSSSGGNNTGHPTGTSTNTSGRLVWTGQAFDCQKLTTSSADSYGHATKSKNGSVLTLASIPTITVDAFGEISLSQADLTITEGNGINLSSTGQITARLGKGLEFDTANNNAIAIKLTTNSGLAVDNNGLKVNTPTCTANTQVLTWNGTALVCVSGTDFNLKANNETTGQNIADNGSIIFKDGTGTTASRTDNSISYSLAALSTNPGSCTVSGTTDSSLPATPAYGATITIPQVTIDQYGRTTTIGCRYIKLPGVTEGNGITVSTSGQISVKTDGSSLTATTSGLKLNYNGTCTSAGQGLSYSGGTIGCTTAYSWNLTAAGTAGSQSITNGSTVNFTAGNGLTVSRSTTNNSSGVLYELVLNDTSGGLVVNSNGLGLKSCSAGEILKYQTVSPNWYCATDLNDWANDKSSVQNQIAAINAKLDKLIGDDGSLLTASDKINPKFMQAGYVSGTEAGCESSSGAFSYRKYFTTSFLNSPVVLVNSNDPNPHLITAQVSGSAKDSFVVNYGSDSFNATWCKGFHWIAIDPSYVFN